MHHHSVPFSFPQCFKNFCIKELHYLLPIFMNKPQILHSSSGWKHSQMAVFFSQSCAVLFWWRADNSCMFYLLWCSSGLSNKNQLMIFKTKISDVWVGFQVVSRVRHLNPWISPAAWEANANMVIEWIPKWYERCISASAKWETEGRKRSSSQDLFCCPTSSLFLFLLSSITHFPPRERSEQR